jgi:hypothetical protein
MVGVYRCQEVLRSITSSHDSAGNNVGNLVVIGIVWVTDSGRTSDYTCQMFGIVKPVIGFYDFQKEIISYIFSCHKKIRHKIEKYLVLSKTIRKYLKLCVKLRKY